MPRAWTLKDYESLNLNRNNISIKRVIESNWQEHRPWEWTNNINTFSPTAAQTRLFYPRSFTASASLNALNSPWFIDYGHLTFWFFFLCTFLLVMWLITLHNLTSKNIETRWPRRETRGFSRAQAGDVMTAVLPLTWSVTMLLHASTHSLNFDENTTATSFSFTVIAYQWGWNYYFPKDIIEKLSNGPKLIGRGHVDFCENSLTYNKLLERAREQYLTRLAIRGGFADRFGRDAVPHLLNLFSRPGGTPTTDVNSSFINALYSTGTHQVSSKSMWRLGLINKFQSQNTTIKLSSDANLVSQLWLSSSLGSRRFFQSRPHTYKLPNNYLFNEKRHLHHYTKIKSKAFRLLQSNFFDKRAAHIVRFNTARSANSLALVGNRLTLIHKHLTKASVLSSSFNKNYIYANFVKKLVTRSVSFAPLHASVPSFIFNTTHYSPIKLNNVTPNMNLLTAVHQLSPFKAHIAGFKNNKNSDILNINQSLNLLKFKQKLKYSGVAHTSNFKSTQLLTFEDAGLNNNAAIKQFNLKINAFTVNAINNLLLITGCKLNDKRVTQPSTNKSYTLSTDINAQTKSVFGAFINTKLVPQPTQSLHSSNFIATQSLNNSLLSENKQLWKFLSLSSNASPISLNNKKTSTHYAPTTQLMFNSLKMTKAAHYSVSPYLMSGSESSLFAKSAIFFQKLTPVTALFKQNITNKSTSDSSHYFSQFNKKCTLLYLDSHTTKLPFCIHNTKLFIFGINSLHAPILNKTNSNFVSVLKRPLLKTRAKQQINTPLTSLNYDFKWTQISSKHSYLCPSFSFWFEGTDLHKPNRSSLDKTHDPLNFAGKSDFIGKQNYIKNSLLFNWYWAWSDITQVYALPAPKLFRGALARRAVGGFWNTAWANDWVSQSALFPENNINLTKQAFVSIIPSFKKPVSGVVYPRLALPALDNEWTKLAHVPVCITAEPYEDLDQSFIHDKWAFEINTTRRSDHSSKYKTVWGPFFIAKIHNPKYTHLQHSHQVLSSVGSGAFANLPLHLLQNVALTNDLLNYKTSVGLLPILTKVNTGRFSLNKQIGPFLFNNLTGVLNTNANSVLVSKPLSSRYKNNPKFVLTTPSYWTTLWQFKSNLNDAQLLAVNQNMSAYSGYWTVRALLTLSTRFNFELNSKIAGLRKNSTNNSKVIGNSASLLADINTLTTKLANKRNTNVSSWNALSGGSALSFTSSLLDKTVNAHLLARSGHSVANDEIGSIRRLRVTKGVYLPSDVAIHAICASKDVIHSWALPGLNIKIDCIPGYNSHRRLMLRWRGAYWGQCMEVCGRYHHWMPILVNVVHKDVFLSWCLTYIKHLDARSLSNSQALFSMASTDVIKLELIIKKLRLLSQNKNLIDSSQFVTTVSYELDI